MTQVVEILTHIPIEHSQFNIIGADVQGISNHDIYFIELG